MRDLLRRLLGIPKEKPEDLIQYEEAKKRLHGAIKNVIHESDSFGKMVVGMQARDYPKKRPKKRKPR